MCVFLCKSLYRLKQVPWSWYKCFVDYIYSIGFSQSNCNHSLFIYKKWFHMTYLLLYVDDNIPTSSSDALRQSNILLLSSKFAIKYLRPLHFFLTCSYSTLYRYLSLTKEVRKRNYCLCLHVILQTVSHPGWTKTEAECIPFENPSLYHNLAGTPQYLTFIRSNIFYQVQQICLFMHNPMETHMLALRCILCDVQGMHQYGLHLYHSSTSSLIYNTCDD